VRNTQALYARYYRYHRIGAASPDRRQDALVPVRSALEAIETVLMQPCFAHPGALDQDGIHAYALALMLLRERAHTAGCVRLTDACDALAVTVAELIEHPAPGHPGRRESRKQFAVHARAMIERETARPARPAVCPLPDRGMAQGARLVSR
jgi:hypothetical protein